MLNVIIADDNHDVRKVLTTIIKWEDINAEVVFSAEDGAAVIDYLKEHEVDLIITDILMPNVTGIELAKHVYSERYGIIVLLLSAYSDAEYVREALKYDVREYFLKPLNRKTLDRITEIARELSQEKERRILHEQKLYDDDYIGTVKDALQRGLSLRDFILEKIGESEVLESVEETTEDFNSEWMEQVLSYIEANYGDFNVSVNGIASHLNLSAPYVSATFKKRMGCNLSTFITMFRMKKATELLVMSQYDIQKISSMVGYENVTSFNRNFKKCFGISPGQFRAEGGRGESSV